MDHEQQADVAALKIILAAVLQKVADPNGDMSASEAEAALRDIKTRVRGTLDLMSVDTSHSSSEAAVRFRQMIGQKIDEMFDSFSVT